MLRCVSVMALAMALNVSFANPYARALEAAGSLPAPAKAMRVQAEISGPLAFQDFCRRTPAECRPDAVASDRPDLTAQRWRDLTEVNDIVNRTVTARSDLNLYGTVDFWTIAGKFGDCEDYALTKQLMLRQRGWPMGALLITVVRDENGEGHAVLTARTGRGDFVLDNRQPRVVPWTATPYQFIKRQSVANPQVWMALAPGLVPPRDPAVAALASGKR
jgi:predicted transglutaminase-like cysteine proteinase